MRTLQISLVTLVLILSSSSCRAIADTNTLGYPIAVSEKADTSPIRQPSAEAEVKPGKHLDIRMGYGSYYVYIAHD